MASTIISDMDLLVEAEENKNKMHKSSEKAPRKMYLAALAVLMYPVAMGMAAAYSATATENMKEKSSRVRPTDEEVSWIGSLLALGALVGGLVSGYLCNKYGRKKTLILSTVPFIAGWIFIAYATNIWHIYVGRLFTGFCCGLVCVTAPSYLVEISTPEVRGLLGSCFQLFGAIGILIISAFGCVLNWNWQAIAGAVTVVIALCCLCGMPESPRWLVEKGKNELAIASIRFFQGSEFDAESECALIQADVFQLSKGNVKLKEICNPCVYRAALFSVGLMFFQQFCGSMVVLFFTEKIFKESGSTLSPVQATVVVDTILVIATAVGCILVDKIGRKILLVVSGVGMAVSLISLGTFDYLKISYASTLASYSVLPLVCIITYIIFMSVGIGAIPWLMTAELSPSQFRSLISAIASFCCWTFVFIVLKTYENILETIHDFGAYWLYAAFCILQCLFAAIVPETKGKSFEEIQKALQTCIFSFRNSQIDKVEV